MELKFIYFTGEENEKQFLEKCVEQWDAQSNNPIQALMQIGAVIGEMRHRIDELEE